MKQRQSTVLEAIAAIGAILLSATSAASADELLDAPSSQGNYLLFPAEVQQERLELQQSDQWRDLKPAQRQQALKDIDRNFLNRKRPAAPAKAARHPIEPSAIAPAEEKPRPGASLGDVSNASGPASPAETRDWAVVSSRDQRPARSSLVLSGTVRAGDLIQLKAPVDGKLEKTPAPIHAWISRRKPVLTVLPAELAAMLSTRQNTTKEEILERWQDTFRPSSVRCPKDCMILSYKIQPGGTVHQDDVVAEAATSLKLEAEISSGLVPEGQGWRSWRLVFWLVTDPGTRWEAEVTDVMDGKLCCRLPSKLELIPGAKWEGRLKNSATTQGVGVGETER